MENKNSRWLDAEEAAKYINVNEQVIKRWARFGRLKGEGVGKAGKVWRFRTDALDRFIEHWKR